jgi:hypothetical protein
MPILRFKVIVDNWENRLFAYITDRDGKVFPFTEGDLISLRLFPVIVNEDGPPWNINLCPEGEYVRGVVLSKAIRVSDNRTHNLRFESDTRNALWAHTAIEDGPTFPFDASEAVITMQLRVTNIQPVSHGLTGEDMATWTAWLVPEGRIVDDIIVCEIERA